MREFAGIRPTPDGCTIDLKVVPGSKSDRLMGVLGNRIKLRTSAPPEDGKANAAVLRFLAERLGLPVRALTLLKGHGAPEKTIAVRGLGAEQAVHVLVGRETTNQD